MHDELTAVAERFSTRGGGSGSEVVGAVARPIRVLDAGISVADLDDIWRDQDITSVAVREAGSDRIGLITRPHFTAAMTGRLGYGRAVLLRRSVGELTDWEPLVVPATMSVAEVASSAMARVGEHRYDDILVSGDAWRVAESADVTLAMVGALAQRSTHDPLTGIPGRMATWNHLQRRCERAKGGRARVVLILLDVQDLRRINVRYGHRAGDVVLKEVATRLAAGRPPGCEVGRIGGDEFVVLATLPPVDEAAAAVSVDVLREQVLATLAGTSGGVPEQDWPAFTSAAAWLGPGASEPDDLLRAAERRLHEARAARRPPPRVAGF